MQGIVLRFVVVIALCILVSGRAWAATNKDGPLAKADHALAEMYEAWEAYLAQGGGAAFTSSTQLLPVSAGWVQIDAVAAGDVHDLQVELNQSTRDSYTRCPRRTDITRLCVLPVCQCCVV